MITRLRDEIRQKSAIELLVNCGSILIILLGVIISIRMLLAGRALWYDESALAFSLCQRSLTELTATELDYVQSAPVGWLYFLKIFSMIFGTSTYALRIPSVIAYVAIMVLVYLILKNVFNTRFPLVGVAFVASIPLVLQYSNVFKPYITDCVFTLLALYLFHLYMEGKLRELQLGVVWAILIWFSNPVVFMEGGLIVAIFVKNILDKDFKSLKKSILSAIKIGIPMVVSFLAYYLYWLRQTAVDNEDMLNYWADWHLPLIPRNIDEVMKLIRHVGYLMQQFYRLEYLILVLLVAFALWTLRKKNIYLIGIYATFVVTAFASFLHMFPVNKRLWLFIYPLIAIIVFVGADAIISKEGKKSLIADVMGIILLGLAVINGGIRYYAKPENTFWPGYEVGFEYDYLLDNIEDEKVYVFSPIIPEFAHVNNYNQNNLDGTDYEVILGKQPLGANYEYEWDLNQILGNKEVYLFFSDSWDNEALTGKLFVENHDKGYLELIYDEYATPLWRYCQDIQDTKASIGYEIVSATDNGDSTTYRVRVINTGETYLNPKFETLVLTNCFEDVSNQEYLDTFDRNNIAHQSFEVPERLGRGESFEVDIDVAKNTSETFKLCNEYGQAVRDEIVLGN